MMEYTGLIEINWSIIMIWITGIVLFLVLKKFFFEKVKNFMETRSNSIQDAFDSAEAVNRRADEKMLKNTKRIANVEAEGREIIRDAKIKADAQAREIIEDANKQATEIMNKAEKNIEREKQKAMEEMRKEVAALAMLAAERIVEREIQNIGQDEIVDEVINKARSTGWQNLQLILPTEVRFMKRQKTWEKEMRSQRMPTGCSKYFGTTRTFRILSTIRRYRREKRKERSRRYSTGMYARNF